MDKLYDIFSGEDLRIAELINRRRLQILVHSCIYYEMNQNIVSDAQWAEWGQELCKLQEEYPEIAKQVPRADEFEAFDPSTGYNLNFRASDIVHTATVLLNNYCSARGLAKPVPAEKPKSVPKSVSKPTKPPEKKKAKLF